MGGGDGTGGRGKGRARGRGGTVHGVEGDFLRHSGTTDVRRARVGARRRRLGDEVGLDRHCGLNLEDGIWQAWSHGEAENQDTASGLGVASEWSNKK